MVWHRELLLAVGPVPVDETMSCKWRVASLQALKTSERQLFGSAP